MPAGELSLSSLGIQMPYNMQAEQSVLGAALMAVLSVPFNYFLVYPAYVVCYGLPLDAIIGMYQAILPSSDSLIKCLTIFNMPFTFCKGMLDVALCFLVYKPLSPLLHK